MARSVAALAGAAVAWAGRNGPPRGYAAFDAAVPWALAAIVVAQYGTSVVTTGPRLWPPCSSGSSLRALRGGRDLAPAGPSAHGSPDELR